MCVCVCVCVRVCVCVCVRVRLHARASNELRFFQSAPIPVKSSAARPPSAHPVRLITHRVCADVTAATATTNAHHATKSPLRERFDARFASASLLLTPSAVCERPYTLRQ